MAILLYSTRIARYTKKCSIIGPGLREKFFFFFCGFFQQFFKRLIPNSMMFAFILSQFHSDQENLFIWTIFLFRFPATTKLWLMLKSTQLDFFKLAQMRINLNLSSDHGTSLNDVVCADLRRFINEIHCDLYSTYQEKKKKSLPSIRIMSFFFQWSFFDCKIQHSDSVSEIFLCSWLRCHKLELVNLLMKTIDANDIHEKEKKSGTKRCYHWKCYDE